MDGKPPSTIHTFRKDYTMKIKITKGPIKHDKIDRKVGEVLEMDEVAGKRLITLGVAEATDAQGTAPTTTEKAADATEKAADATDTLLDVDKMTRDQLAQELSVRGVMFKPHSSRNELLAALKEALVKP